MEELLRRKYVTKIGPASEMELMRFFTTLSILKLAKFKTLVNAYERLLPKLEVIN